MKKGWRVAASLLLLLPTQALAHHAEWMKGMPFVQGVSMPLHGVDHMLVALAVGLMAAQLGGAARWALPSVFAIFMLIAGLLNVNGIAVPGIEPAILGSVLILGVLLSRRRPVSAIAGAALVALLAVIQGDALIQSPATPSPDWSLLRFSIGCVLSSLVLLGSGVALGIAIERFQRREILRYAGATIVAAGILIYMFPAANDLVIHLLEPKP